MDPSDRQAIDELADATNRCRASQERLSRQLTSLETETVKLWAQMAAYIEMMRLVYVELSERAKPKKRWWQL